MKKSKRVQENRKLTESTEKLRCRVSQSGKSSYQCDSHKDLKTDSQHICLEEHGSLCANNE